MSDGFLSRWSRLKNEAKAEPQEPPALAPAPAEQEHAEAPPPDLPPVETLTKDSDFSAFLQAGVPEELKKAALAKLWTSDPLFSQPEVFDLHMEDYSFPSVPEVVRTAWNFGKEVVEELADRSANFPEASENLHKNNTQDKEPTPGS